MKNFVAFVVLGSVERLGWTLVHSLWQLTLIALLAVIVDRMLKRRSARARYLAAVSAFSLMVVIPIATWSLNAGWDQRSAGPRSWQISLKSEVSTSAKSAYSSVVVSDLSRENVTVHDLPMAYVSPDTNVADSMIDPSRSAEPVVASASQIPSPVFESENVSSRSELPRSLFATVAAWIEPRLPVTVGIWLIGIVVCSIRPLWSLWVQWRLRRSGLSAVPESLQSAMLTLSERMGLTRVIRIAESTLVKVPMVVGYLRPIILLPASVITGLTPVQLEAVLAHELAHIRRHDWRINALQVMAETLLFYHPAVWWLSNRIRQERELCCDDIALSLNVDKAVYARTLLTLEELRQESFTPALAATGGDLASRVRRLLPITTAPHTSRSSVTAMPVMVASALLFFAIGSASLVARSMQDTHREQDLQLKGLEASERTVTGQVLNVDGKPAVQVLVAYGPNRLTAFETLRTDDNGRYEFAVSNNMKAQPFRIFIIPDSAAAVSRAITKGFGEQPVFRLQPGTRLTGKVLDASGRGVPNVVVQAEGGNVIPTRYAITDANGEYTTPPCQYGSYEITPLNEGAIPNAETKGARLGGGYLRIQDAISKTARTSQKIPDFRPVESIHLDVHLLQSDGSPVAGERLFLSGSYGDQSWLQQFREIEGHPGSYELMVPKGLSGEFIKLDKSRIIDGQYVFGGPGAAIREFNRDESTVLFRKAVSWIDLRVTVAGRPITYQNQLREISGGETFPGPFLSRKEANHDVFYSIQPNGDTISSRFQNTDILGPVSRDDSRLSIRVAPDTEYSIHLFNEAGFSWKGNVYLKEGEMKLVTANLVSTETSATASDEPKPAFLTDDPVDVATSEAEQQRSKPIDDVRRRSVQVLDENEQPVVGVEVRFQFEYPGLDGVRTLKLLKSNSDDKGIAAVEFPAGSKEVIVGVKADGFGEFSETQQPAGNTVIHLSHGRVLRIRAVDGAGRILKQAVPILAGKDVMGREFEPQADGTFRLSSVPMDRRILRVAAGQVDGPTLFSDLVDVMKTTPGNDGVLELTLRPGTRLNGKLDDSVPRPVSEGYAELIIIESTAHKLEDHGWKWKVPTPVQPDGSFTFESLPSGGHAQLHVLVDGFVSSNPTAEAVMEYLANNDAADEDALKKVEHVLSIHPNAMLPQWVRLDAPQVDVVVPCEKTASCDFRLLDPSGNPVAGAEVHFNPNGVFFFDSLFIPGTQFFQNSALVEVLRRGGPVAFNQPDPGPCQRAIKAQRSWVERSFLKAKSDNEGRVRVRNLPGGQRQSFSVTAQNFVMPESPLFTSRRDDPDDPDQRRAGVVELTAGETLQRTIYLERRQSVIEREILLVNPKGKPISNATVALAEMRTGPKDWQLWSTQRFGAIPTNKTDPNGRVVLSVPDLIDEIPVERLRLALEVSTNDLWLFEGLVEVPAKNDDGMISIVPDTSYKPIGDEGSRTKGQAIYQTMLEILSIKDEKRLLEALIEQPSVGVLRELLKRSPGEHPGVVEWLDEGRRGAYGKKGFKVHVLKTSDGAFAVVPVLVNPVGETRSNVKDPSELPECVFVFDMDGRLIVTLGGEIGTTGAGNPDRSDILNLGSADDWFVRITRFQDNGPFEYQSTYYRIGNPVVNSLRYFHYANSNAWSNGPEKIARYGSLYFKFPDSKGNRAGETVGVTTEGASVNGIIFWDGDKNHFVGAAAQGVDGRPLYKVDTEWSKDFQALIPKPNQMILSGGAREYDHWYGWDTVVPEGFEAVVSVSILALDGSQTLIEQRLNAGRQHIQFQAKPSEDGKSGILQLDYLGSDKIHKATIPFPLDDRPAKQPAIVNTLSPGESVRLVNRPLKGSKESLTLDVKLKAAEL